MDSLSDRIPASLGRAERQTDIWEKPAIPFNSRSSLIRAKLTAKPARFLFGNLEWLFHLDTGKLQLFTGKSSDPWGSFFRVASYNNLVPRPGPLSFPWRCERRCVTNRKKIALSSPFCWEDHLSGKPTLQVLLANRLPLVCMWMYQDVFFLRKCRALALQLPHLLSPLSRVGGRCGLRHAVTAQISLMGILASTFGSV